MVPPTRDPRAPSGAARRPGEPPAPRRETGWKWIGKLVTGYFRSGPGYECWRTNGTPDWVITCTYAGIGRYGHALGEITAEPGQLVLLKPGTLHDYSVESTRQYWEFAWAHFHPRPSWVELLAWPEEAPGLMRLDLDGSPYRARVSKRMRDMHDLHSTSERLREELAMNALEEVLLWADAANPARAQPADERVRQAMDHCCRNLADDITLASLAKVCGLSPSRLSFLFQEQAGMPPMRWLEHQRLARAKDLLEVTAEPVQRVAEQVGFQDPFYFSARFRKATGQSPRAWRRKAQLERGGGHD